MAIPAQDIRRQIDRHLDEIGELEELSDARYHVTHERFERASNQRSLIIDWLRHVADATTFPPHRPTRMLSVGCGGGVMDQRITNVFAGYVDALTLAGVDPNPEHTRTFESLFADKGFAVNVFNGLFEDYRPGITFDVVHFVHCLYYFEHIGPELRSAAEMLAPGGIMIVLQAPNEDLNHLADRVWKKQFDQSAWYSDDVLAALEPLGLDTRMQRLAAHVDVTECFEAGNPAGVEILDFIVQAETQKFSPAFQARLRESLRAICHVHGNRLLAEHPVDAIVSRKSAPDLRSSTLPGRGGAR